MAETPFPPESGAVGGGTAPEDGTREGAVLPSDTGSPEPLPASTAPSELTAEEVVSVEPVPSEPVAAAAPPTAALGAGETPDEPSPSEPDAPPPAPLEQPGPPPGVAATITVPPLENGESGGGGEWELLLERLGTWWNSGELNRQWQRIRGPLKGVAILVAVLLALQVYATVVRTIDAIPLVSGLLELTGLIAVLQFSATRLLRSSDRQEVVSQLQRRWQDFRGRD